MNVSVISLLLHIGTIASDVGDVKKLITDLLAKSTAVVPEDIAKLVTDLTALISSGLIPLPPGMTQDQATQILASLSTVV